MIDDIKKQINDSIELKKLIVKNDDLLKNIQKVAELIIEAFRNGKKLLLCGNGGSAADAQHIAAEFVGRFKIDRMALPAIALTTDSSIMTSISNDYSYDNVLQRQVEALAQSGDIIIGISTSGNSNNILYAFEQAKKNEAFSVGLLGKDGGKCGIRCDFKLIVPGYDTPRIQEAHIMIGHIICDIVEKNLFGNKNE